MTYTDEELAIYERGLRHGYAKGRQDGINEVITLYTEAGRKLAREAAVERKPKRRPLTLWDYIVELMA